MLLLQIPPPPNGSIDPFIGWVLFAIVSLAGAAITALWRQSVSESKRKDALIDRLLDQIGKAASATDRTVKLAERRDREREGQ